MKADKLKGHLDLLLLEILSAAPAHGYAVVTALRDRSEGAFDLPEGTVYPALHRLEDGGLLASEWTQVAGRRRRMYRLTDAGHAAARSERRQWRSFVTAIDTVLGGPTPAATLP